jgi:hypothetical protein
MKMHLDLPQDIIERVRRRTAEATGQTEADVIRRALDSLDRQEGERIAIQQGIDAWRHGQVRDFGDFDREFRTSCDISNHG